MQAHALRAAALAPLLALAACAPDPRPAPRAEGGVVVQVFSDPQCWACRRFYLENLKPAMAELGGRGVRVEHHLLTYYEHARAASSLVLAGERLGPGGSERVLGAVFETQAEWAEDGDVAGALARSFSPDELAALRTHAASPGVAATLAREAALAERSGVTRTPTVYVLSGGERHRVPSTVQYPIFRRYLNSRLEE
ncbi:MAG TPA: thioredoxin domain-containing protein [Longimicrobium sp.]|nr:thioredoxin domain-containing protein [Longimicrobium sp.]